jgi:hypothetical protein
MGAEVDHPRAADVAAVPTHEPFGVWQYAFNHRQRTTEVGSIANVAAIVGRKAVRWLTVVITLCTH